MTTLFIFASRNRPGEDRYLQARVALMCVGAGLGLAGMLLDITWLLLLALVALLAGVALRHLPSRDQAVADDLPEDGDDRP